MFVGVAGRPYAEFQRAVERGNLFQAEANARLVAAATGGRLGLGDALALLFLMAAKHDQRYEQAALRWHSRFEREVAGLTIEESQLALAALAALERLDRDGTAEDALLALCRRHGIAGPKLWRE